MYMYNILGDILGCVFSSALGRGYFFCFEYFFTNSYKLHFII